MRSSYHPRKSRLRYALLAGAAGLSVYWLMHRSGAPRPPDSAPGRTARRSRFGEYIVSGRSVTVNASRDSLYDQWRDVKSLAKLLDYASDVMETSPNRWSWVLKGPPERQAFVEVDLVEDRPGEVLVWKSTPASEIEANGKIAFSDAPAGRGVRVEATISYKPPFGQPGHWVAKLTGHDPSALARHALKRMKMIAETGELATASNQREA